MGVNLFKTPQVIFFGFILPLISLSISWIFYQFIPEPPFWLETISPLYAYIVLYTFFDKRAWGWWIFKVTGVSNLPDLRGRWKGVQISTYKENGNNIKVNAVLEVRQSFTKITVRAYYEKSKSESSVANFSECNGKNYLFYTYDNDPNSLKYGTMQTHKGTAKVEYLQKENRLIGLYFNSIGNGGDMDFHFEQKELLDRF